MDTSANRLELILPHIVRDCEICHALCSEWLSINGVWPPSLRDRAIRAGVDRLVEHLVHHHKIFVSAPSE
jgi:hypothetical protein